MNIKCLATLVVLPLVLLSCKKDDSIVNPIDYGSITSIIYSAHVQPLLARSCAATGCHDGATKAAGLSLVSWQDAIKGSMHGEVLIPFQPARSLFVTLFDGTAHRKPHPAVYGLAEDEVRFLKRWILEGARYDDGAVPFAHSARRLYVPNQGDDNVAIIDIDNLVAYRYVDVGNSPASDAPHFVVATQHHWYVSLISAREVWKFDAHTDTLLAVGRVDAAPAILELTPDGSKLYVSQFMTSSTNRISVLETSSMTLLRTIPVWTMPHGMRMNHSGTRLFVASMMSDNISIIDVQTDSVVATLPVAYDASPFGPTKYMPMEIAVSPNDSLVLVTCSEMREVRMFDATTYALIDSFQVGDQPWHLQFTPDGEFCYVSNRRGNSVSVIHIPMRHVMNTIVGPLVLAYPHGCDVSGDGRYTFVSNENVNHRFTPRYNVNFVGNVAVIDNLTGQIVKVLDVGQMPTGLSVAK